MKWYEVLGYVGSVLMFSTFYMKTMVPLRVAGIGANVCMILYTASARIYPVLILQACLLPLNVFRLVQMRRLVTGVARAAETDFKLDALVPFMQHERAAVGTVLFRRGEKADKMYLIRAGSVRLEELSRTLGAGELLGEIGVLSADSARTATAVVEREAELLTLTEDRVLQLYAQDPRFGLYLMRLVIRRLLRNADPRPSALPGEAAAALVAPSPPEVPAMPDRPSP